MSALPNFALHPHAVEGRETEVARPVVVRPSFYFFSVSKFDDRNATATVSYRVAYSWTDPRLAGWPADQVLP
eukprot:COSAG03_NODE_14066_length_478_cov_1.005277_1_plen_71_part_10